MKDYLSMENTNPTAQTLMRYSTLENVIISGVSTVSGVAISELMSSSKKKEVALAKSVACAIFDHYGYGVREIGRLLNIDHKGVAVYIGSHENRLADKKYLIKYNKSMAFVGDYEMSTEVLLNKVMGFDADLKTLQDKYEHLKELLTSN